MAGVSPAALFPAALKPHVPQSDLDTDTPEDCERVVQTETETETEELSRQCVHTETETEEEGVMGQTASYCFSDEFETFAARRCRRRLTTLMDNESDEEDDESVASSDDEPSSSSSSSSDDGAEADAELFAVPSQRTRRVSRPKLAAFFKEPEQLTKESLLSNPPVTITRSRSVEVSSRPRSLSKSVSRRRRSIRDADGDRATFVRWQDQTGRTGRPLRRRSGAISLTEEGASALRIAVQKRTNEQCKWVLLNSVCERQKLRYPTLAPPPAAQSEGVRSPQRRTRSEAVPMVASRCSGRVISRRQAVGENAVRFQLVLSATEETIDQNLGFSPPARSHSVAPGEVEFLLH